MSIIKANKWQSTNGTVRSTVLQTVTVNVNQNFSYIMSDVGTVGSTNNADGDAGVDISPLSITITPQFANSRILIIYYTMWGITGGNYASIRIKRGIAPSAPSLPGSASWMNQLNGLGTQAVRGAASITGIATHAPMNCTFQVLDSPNTTSAVTYIPNVKGEADSSSTFYLNRIHYNNNDYGQTTAVSTVTAMEIAQ
jgi:hypothetical protein